MGGDAAVAAGRASAARYGGWNRSPGASSVGLAMLRAVVLAGALLAAVAAPAHAGGHGGGHGGRGFHGHHGGFRHHGFHSFVGVGVFAPWPGYPYDYPYYPYPYDYPYAYPPPVVVEPVPPLAQEPIQREVVYPTGKYVLHGDGITEWQWVWIPAASSSPLSPAP